MIIVGVDYRPSVQQIAFFNSRRNGKTGERQLSHSDGEAKRSSNYSEDRPRCRQIGPLDMHVR